LIHSFGRDSSGQRAKFFSSTLCLTKAVNGAFSLGIGTFLLQFQECCLGVSHLQFIHSFLKKEWGLWFFNSKIIVIFPHSLQPQLLLLPYILSCLIKNCVSLFTFSLLQILLLLSHLKKCFIFKYCFLSYFFHYN